MKEQSKNASDQTNEEEIDSQPEKGFRVRIVKMIQNLGDTMEKIKERFVRFEGRNRKFYINSWGFENSTFNNR